MPALYVLFVLIFLGCGGAPPSLGPPLSPEAAAGQKVFLELSRPRCGRCHVLRHAGTDGRLGSDLDEHRPNRERVLRVLRRGIGTMKPQVDILTPTELEQLATYVTEVAGRGLESD